ncbi:MAG: hypothetical protein ABJP66_19130 [Hyphomicrobiales bacterium]
MIDSRPGEGQTQYNIREIYDDETGVIRVRQVRLGANLHSPPSGEPSHAIFDSQGRPRTFEWHHNGIEHADSGEPSSITFYPDDDMQREFYRLHDQPRPNVHGPFIVDRQMSSGTVLGTKELTEPFDRPNDLEP